MILSFTALEPWTIDPSMPQGLFIRSAKASASNADLRIFVPDPHHGRPTRQVVPLRDAETINIDVGGSHGPVTLVNDQNLGWIVHARNATILLPEFDPTWSV